MPKDRESTGVTLRNGEKLSCGTCGGQSFFVRDDLTRAVMNSVAILECEACGLLSLVSGKVKASAT